MSILITKNWRDRKPPLGSQINWGHPLSQGLVGCWLMNEGAGKIVQDTTNNLGSGIFGASATMTWRPGKLGQSVYFNDLVGDVIVVPFNLGKRFDGKCPITIASYVRNVNATGAEGRIFSQANEIVLRINTSDDPEFILNSFTTNDRVAIAKTSADTRNKINFFAGVYNGVDLKVYLNRESASVVPTGSYGTGAVDDYNIGGAAATQEWEGEIYFVYIWRRGLTQNELFSLYEAPYQFIQPIRRRIFSIPSGVPPVTEEEEYDFMEYNKYW